MIAPWTRAPYPPAWLLIVCIAVPISAASGGSVRGSLKATFAPDRTVVYLKSVPETLFSATPIPAKLSQKRARFTPRVLPVLKGTTVDLSNDDWVEHSVYSMSLAKVFDLGIYGRDIKKEITFDKEGRVDIDCYIHSKMSAVILVLQNPFFTRSDSDGAFVLDGVPAGTYELEGVSVGRARAVYHHHRTRPGPGHCGHSLEFEGHSQPSVGGFHSP